MAPIVAAIIYIAVVITAKMSFPRTGWSVRDSHDYHFPVINYFLQHGLNRAYPLGLSMIPGMHVLFSGVATIFGLRSLDWDGVPAFLIQSVGELLFLGAVTALYRLACARGSGSWPLLLPLLCSSIPFASWLWPTTDLGPLVAFLCSILVLARTPRLSLASALTYAALVLVASLFRQNYATLGFAYGFYYLINDSAGCRVRPAFSLLCASIPVLASLTAIGVAYWLWHGLTPPTEQWHGSATTFHVTTVVHVLAYAGLMCWPVLLLLGISLRQQPREALVILAVAAGLALLTMALVPLSYDKEAGRVGSLFWSLIGPMPLSPWRYAVLAAVLLSGFLIALGIGWLSWQRRFLRPEIAALGLYVASLIVQSQPWQRYIEPQVIICVVLFFGFPPRQAATLRVIYAGWFSAYILVGLGKAYLGASVG